MLTLGSREGIRRGGRQDQPPNKEGGIQGTVEKTTLESYPCLGEGLDGGNGGEREKEGAEGGSGQIFGVILCL